MANPRSFEGHMDWQYNNQGPVDATSPFVQASQRSKISSFASSPSKLPPNPFARTDSGGFQSGSPFKSQPPLASQSQPSFFGGGGGSSFDNRPRAPAFRNASFTTPQRRVEESFTTEFSPAESSPAATDTSEMPLDTPDRGGRGGGGGRVDDGEDSDFAARMSTTPATAAKRNPFAYATIKSGRGEVPRATPRVDVRQRDKVRKRKRQFGDRDVGSVRGRLGGHDSEDSESDWDDEDASPRDDGRGRGRGGDRRRGRSRHHQQPQQPQKGWFSSFLGVIHDHPDAPVILSWWIQFGINLFFACMGALIFVALGHMVMSDFRYAAAEARSRLLAEMEACTHEYTKNRCAPKAERLPALAVVCDEWEACMNQDPEKIKSLAISSKQMAITINEFFNVLSFKAWGFILSLVIVFLLANNLGFNKFRQSMNAEVKGPAAAAPSQPAGIQPPPQHHHPQLFPPPHSQDTNRAFIWAPVTPKNLRRGLFLNEASETDDSPSSDVKAIMPPPPSGRRSPSKGDRERAYSPTKHRSPTKFY